MLHFRILNTIALKFPTSTFLVPFTLLLLAFPIRSNSQFDKSVLKGIVETDKNLVHFISKLASIHFTKCALLVLQDNLEDLQPESRAVPILESTSLNAKYMVNFRNDTGQMSTDSAILPLTFVPHLSNIRQHSDECMLSIILINSPNMDFIEQVKSLIAPTYLPVTRRDVDHYIFVSKPEDHQLILKIPVFISRIKFKLAIGEDSQAKQVKVSTIDYFGGPGGTPKLIQLPNKVPSKKLAVFPDFFWNLRGYTLKVVYNIYIVSMVQANPPPWAGVKNNARRGVWRYLFSEYLMIKFNFTYNWFPSTGLDGKMGTGGSGVQMKNGTWVGVVGDLYNGNADVGLAIANTDKRIHFIGFTDSNFDTGCLTFVTGQASKLYSNLAMIWPFEISLWVSIIISTLIIMVWFYLVTRFLQRLHLEPSALSTINTQVLLIVAPYLEQDSPIQPISHTLRCFIALWEFFIMIITTLYRSKLVTLLAFPVLGIVPKTFDELAFSKFEVGFMRNGDSAYNTFVRSTDPVYVSLTQRMEVMKGINLDCLKKVVNKEQYACIGYNFDIMYLHQRNFSDLEARKLKYSGARTYNVWLGICTEAQSMFRINFEKVLGQTMPFYLAEIWKKVDMYENIRQPKLHWWKATNQTDKLEVGVEESEDELTLKNIKGIFYIYLISIAVCILAFLKEIFSCKKLCCCCCKK